MNKLENLNLLYSGGSGGFFLLHLLLLSKEYISCFPTNLDLKQIVEQQWNILEPAEWKKTEISPDNNLTLNLTTDLKKIYFYCNPDNEHSRPLKFGKTNLVLYTDYDSQKKLAFYKKAYWFYQKSYKSENFYFLRQFVKQWHAHYNNIKDLSWPPCPSIKKIKNLPVNVQQELFENSNTKYFVNGDYLKFDTDIFNEVSVKRSMIYFLKNANYTVCLQDLVNSNAKILVDLNLIKQVNQDQMDLIKKWKKLHPPDLLKDIGIISIE